MPNCDHCHAPLETQGARSFCPACLLRQVMGDDEPFDEEPTIIASAMPGSLPELAHYTVMENLGEGGFAIVYRAMQREPVRREVAVKVLKPLVASANVLARFELERQTLARMEHPGIARLWDSGVTANGLPFFAMELVRGEPITAYCKRHALTLRQRLELFCGICDAVQHAHEKGVLHRDLKPSNILVTGAGDGGQVKIIDFGIAKALEETPNAPDSLAVTALHQTIGTPGYMSPEQAEWGALRVDARSDLYALGVVLYELITGRTPLQVEQRTDDKAAHRVVARHVSAPSKLAPDLLATKMARRDLDAITGKALAEDSALRYASAAALAEDVRHHLNNEPVQAGERSWTYVMQKFTRRHLPFVISSGLTLLAILGGFTVSTALYFKEQQARTKAQEAQGIVEKREAELSTTLSRADFAAAQRFKQDGEYQNAVACLTRALRQDATFEAAAVDLRMMLSQEDAPQPVEAALPLDPAWGQVVKGAVAASGHELAAVLETSAGQRLMLFVYRDGGWVRREMAIKGTVGAVAISGAGDALVFSDGDHLLHIVSTLDKGAEMTWQAPEEVTALVASVKGRTAVVGCKDGGVWVASGDDALLAKKVGQMTGAVSQLHLAPGDGGVIVGSVGGEVIKYHLMTPAKDLLVIKMPGAVTAIADAEFLGVVGVGDALGNVACVDGRQEVKMPVTQLHQGRVTAVALTGVPTELISAGGGAEQRVRWTDLTTYKDVETPLESAGTVRSILPVVGTDEALIINADSSVRVWRRDGEVRTTTMRKPQNAKMLAMSSVGQCMAVQRDFGKGIETLLLAHRSPIHTQFQFGKLRVPGNGASKALAFAPEGNRLIAASPLGRAALWDVAQARLLGDGLWKSPALAMGPAQNGMMYATLQDGSLIEIGLDGREPVVRLPATEGDAWAAASVSPDGRAAVWATLATNGGQPCKARAWWADEGKTQDIQMDRLTAVAVHGGTHRVALGLGNGYVRVVKDGADRGTILPLHQTRITTLHYSADGHALITGSTDGTAAVWDAQTLAPLTDYFHLDSAVLGTAFSGDGRRFACVTGNQLVVGDVASRSLIGRPLRMRRLGGLVALNKDGTRAAVSIASGEVTVHDIAPLPGSPAPDWFLDLADGYVSRHMTAQGTIERWDHPGQAALLGLIPVDADNDSWRGLALWLFTHTGLRSLTPWSPLTLEQYINAVSERPSGVKANEMRRLRPFIYRSHDDLDRADRRE